MALRKARPHTFQPHGVSDTVDGTNSFKGSMASLANLIPNPSTDRTFVPRPGAVSQTSFAGFNTPGVISAELVVGNIAYGMIASAKNAGKDEPYAFNLITQTFQTITGVLNANTPTSPATSGDWVPPIMAVVGSRIIVTHPGFAGGAVKFGWLDISGFTSTSITGTTHTSTTIDTLSANVLQAGWNVGMSITGAGIVAGTTIKSIAADGLSIVLSVATTAGAGGVALSVSGGTAASPQWAAGDTNGNNLTAVPVAVAQMAGRAYYAVGSGVVFSDSGNATQVTNASQALLFNNGLTVTALGALPLSSPFTGGIVQSIMAFQSNAAIQQITGDASISAGNTGALSVNLLKAGTGTLAPLSVCNVNVGLAFMSPEGLRFIDFYGRVTDPIGDHGTGVAVPFIYALTPSRICAAANADVLRISVTNGFAAGTPVQEYWFDLTRKAWTGPHSFPASLIQAWGSTFLLVGSGISAKLWQSDAEPGISSSYTENGTALAYAFTTSLLPDNQEGAMNQMVETTIAVNLPPQASMTVTVTNENGTVLDSVVISGSGQAATTWGSFTWGAAPWFGGAGIFRQTRLAWHVPLVFKQAQIMVTGNSLGGLVVGNIYGKFQQAGYNLEATA